jgi:aminoglycoside phosphotransferase (APT) family kinase protein
MIGRAYGADQVPHAADEEWVNELGHGWFNVAYLLRLRDGRRVVCKIAPPPHVEVMTYERGAMDIELATPALITAHLDVPVPTVDYADRSHELCDADYFFMPYIDADNLGIVKDTLAPGELDAYNEALGAATRDINSIRGTAFGPLAGPADPTWRTCFSRMIEDVLADGERERRKLYTLYLILIMIIETDYRGHTDTSQYDWARARLHEVMALFGKASR